MRDKLSQREFERHYYGEWPSLQNELMEAFGKQWADLCRKLDAHRRIFNYEGRALIPMRFGNRYDKAEASVHVEYDPTVRNFTRFLYEADGSEPRYIDIPQPVK